MLILVMGVTGSGKTTVGKLLARRLKCNFLDADDFHSAANREKMHQGIPLTDADRAPWLAALHSELVRAKSAGQGVVLACSALKQEYRNTLAAGLNLNIVFLRGTVDQLHRNLATRANHFAGESLVPSQLATLEEPVGVIVEDIAVTPREIVEDICARLKM
jgi:gluconokinase|nr:gluconokinase, GntK/IdnK-type [Candidatus Acidoferrales bacterium]